MAKNRYGKMQGNMQYNRPSGGYQKNVYKQQLKTEGIKQPKGMDQKKLRNIAIAAGVVWVLLSILLIWKLNWSQRIFFYKIQRIMRHPAAILTCA